MLYGVLQCLNYLTDAAERLSNLSGVEIAFEYTDDYDDEEDNEDDEEEEDEDEEGEDEEGQEGETPTGDAPRRPVYITRDQIMQLLGHAGLGRIFASDLTPRQVRRRNMRVMEDEEDAEEDEDEENAGGGSTRKNLRSRRPRGKVEFEKVPSEQGQVLMNAGNFGSNPRSEDTVKRKKKLAYDIMRRELGLGSEGRQKNATRLLKQDMIPESVADTIIHYNARCYSGQFSDDGNFFFSCAQDFRVRMYDTSNPYDWKYYKSVVYPYGQWTITDASLSPDNRFLAYSSIRSIVCLAPTDPENDSEPTLLDFANIGTSVPRGFHTYFGVRSQMYPL
jgi:WD repeat-containing protein 23